MAENTPGSLFEPNSVSAIQSSLETSQDIWDTRGDNNVEGRELLMTLERLEKQLFREPNWELVLRATRELMAKDEN